MASSSELPSYDAYMTPILQALKAHGGSMTIEEMAEDVPARGRVDPHPLARSTGSGSVGPSRSFEARLCRAPQEEAEEWIAGSDPGSSPGRQ